MDIQVSSNFERFLYYLGPTPKIIFFPIMIMWFGVGPPSKIALGTLSCFFPIALSVAARALVEQMLPARLHTQDVDGLDATACAARPAALQHIMISTTSQGGQNAVVILRRSA